MKLKIYRYTLLISIGFILISFIAKLLGCNDFNIPIIDNAINNNYILMIICYLLLFNINSILVIILIVKRKLTLKELLFCIGIFSSEYLITINFVLDYLSFIIEIILLSIISIVLTKKCKILIEVLIISCLNILYQLISLITRNVFVGVADETFTTNLILNIDYYGLLVISILYFLKKGANIYELVFKFIYRWRTKTFIILLPDNKCEEKLIQQNQNNVQEVEIGYVVFLILLGLFQILLVGFLCYLIKGTIWNFIFIFISFVLLRFAFGKSWHANTMLKCTTLAMVVFTAATKLSLDINISILSCVVVGLLLAFILHILYYYNLKNDYSKLSKEDLSVALSYLNATEINMLYDYYHRGNTSVEDIADKYGYNKMKIYRILNKIKKEKD